MTVETIIAYRDKDLEGDVWSERAFLFKDRDAVEKFFVANNPQLNEIYNEGGKEIEEFEVYKSPSGQISCVEFKTDYAGEVRIYEMQDGYIIEMPK